MREFISNRYTVPTTENDFRIKMGSDVSHVNVSLIVQGQSHETVIINNNVIKIKVNRSGGVEPVSFRLPAASALPPGQAGSRRD